MEAFDQYKIKQDLMQSVDPLGDAKVPYNINIPIQDINMHDYLSHTLNDNLTTKINE